MKTNRISSAPPAALPAAERREAERSEDSRSAAAGNAVAPAPPAPPRTDPEVVAYAKRRSFTAEYKLRLLAEIDAATLNPAPSESCSAVKAFTPRTWSPGVANARPVFSRA